MGTVARYKRNIWRMVMKVLKFATLRSHSLDANQQKFWVLRYIHVDAVKGVTHGLFASLPVRTAKTLQLAN